MEQHIQQNTLNVGLYHGPNRFQRAIDIVGSRYCGDVVWHYFNRFFKVFISQEESVQFRRINLDEAHMIRNLKSKKYAGCMELQASYRLCIAGTTVQNKPEDIDSLLSCLQVHPL